MQVDLKVRLKDLLVRGTTDALAEANRSIVRGYLALAAIYYSAIIPVHFIALEGAQSFRMIGFASLAAIVAISGWLETRNSVSANRLEFIAGATNLVIFANVLAAIHTNYNQSDLIYFPMMALGFAFISVTTRLAISSVGVVLLGLIFEIKASFAGQGGAYIYIAVATAITGLAFAGFLRRAIGVAIQAKEAAENSLSEAEGKLIEAERLTMKMRGKAMTDSLTGLPNRRAFFQQLKTTSFQQKESDKRWLIAIDLDGFKMVNDVYGHMVGDALLIEVSRRMQEYCGTNAKICRIGGDEFNVVLDDVANAQQCQRWCEKLLRKISEPYDVEGRLIQISASMGCINMAKGAKGGNGNILIRNADYALLTAKKRGKNRVVAFNREHEKAATERFKIEDALRAADFATEIQVLFQPQVNIADDKILRAETLARWDCPSLGMVEPDRFITVAEESGLISKITLTVLKKAIAALRGWDKPIPLAINLSGLDLLSNQVMDEIIAEVEGSGLEPSLIEFEITETAMMADTQKASVNLYRLSRLGCGVALDDFGTGYSNFNYLRELPIDKLKVDRSFVNDISNPMTEKILHSLTVTASALGVDCLLEGVEDELQLVLAKRVGVQSVQGYLFGKPMEGEQLSSLIVEQGGQGSSQLG